MENFYLKIKNVYKIKMVDGKILVQHNYKLLSGKMCLIQINHIHNDCRKII